MLEDLGSPLSQVALSRVNEEFLMKEGPLVFPSRDGETEHSAERVVFVHYVSPILRNSQRGALLTGSTRVVVMMVNWIPSG